MSTLRNSLCCYFSRWNSCRAFKKKKPAHLTLQIKCLKLKVMSILWACRVCENTLNVLVVCSNVSSDLRCIMGPVVTHQQPGEAFNCPHRHIRSSTPLLGCFLHLQRCEYTLRPKETNTEWYRWRSASGGRKRTRQVPANWQKSLKPSWAFLPPLKRPPSSAALACVLASLVTDGATYWQGEVMGGGVDKR